MVKNELICLYASNTSKIFLNWSLSNKPTENIEKEIIPVILAGGSGTRLWPVSRYCHPKQFKSLNGNSEFSLLQETIQRLFLAERHPAALATTIDCYHYCQWFI